MSNPVLNQKNFERDIERIQTLPIGQTMTINGTLQVLGFMSLIMLVSACYSWTRFSLGYTDMALMLTGIGAIAGFILALFISFFRFSPNAVTTIKYFVPFYAACEGLFLGGISASFEASYPGIISTAIAGTFAALFSMLILYRANIVRCTDKFKSVIFIGTLSIAGIYFVDIIGHLFGHSVPLVYSASPWGILFSIVIVLFAAFNLIIDFEFVEQGVLRNFPKDYEWYGAFGLMVTIVWLYVEILRLIAKFQRR